MEEFTPSPAEGVAGDDAVERLVEEIMASRPPGHFTGCATILQDYATAAVKCQRMAARAREDGRLVLVGDDYEDSLAQMLSLATVLRLWPDRVTPPGMQP